MQAPADENMIVLSTRNAGRDTKRALLAFAQQTGLTDCIALSSDDASSVALETRCPHGWSINEFRPKASTNQIDVNIVSTYIRRKKLLLADMDATIIQGESLDELADLAGVANKIVPITRRAMAGELGFEDALTARLNLLTGQPKSLLDQVVNNTIITDGADEVVKTMRNHGAHCYLVSGGFTFLTDFVAKQLGFTGHHGNMLEIANGLLTGRAVPPIIDQQAKLTFLKRYIKEFNLTPDDCLCVGDGANDMNMLQHAGMGVAFEGKPALRRQIDLQLNYTDLTGLLYIQGYHSAEFLTDRLY